jgi:acyl-CoA synthetase (AMP-forming)/AMP-acid ligase II
MDAAGMLLPTGAAGEVVIRGPNVTAGYDSNPDANRRAFVDGWFRTGDEGVLDQDGYLRLTGRLKEQINRAGEKISPLEVDAVLLAHPAVRQAVTFAVPDQSYGEAVGAAVVLRPGASLDAAALRQFAAARLADFKVPSRILFVADIPKGATGKLRRIGLAEQLGLALPPGTVALHET